jgi:Tfp pilus assembly protein PilN
MSDDIHFSEIDEAKNEAYRVEQSVLDKRDTEIARLKADWRQQAETAQLRLQKIESQQKLITELADALEEVLPMKQYAAEFKLPFYDLLKRGREATR